MGELRHYFSYSSCQYQSHVDTKTTFFYSLHLSAIFFFVWGGGGGGGEEGGRGGVGGEGGGGEGEGGGLRVGLLENGRCRLS